ncbi:hypothetical protein P171DRAFT_510651 [Karstenula rhodostoma CBS 690.94]|uniref:Uncharacterized protein n=1 Tax=Karstenula rhodostoma CBS 690.94 TaxID=1392251 RepID=A0A9P4PMD6_9PLEO|nr:hypothetical protein P171DRAFT_510651 [Karstenula rhodostoma CBS 690.94]
MGDTSTEKALVDEIRLDYTAVDKFRVTPIMRQSLKLCNADDNQYITSTPTLCISHKPGYLRIDCNEIGFSEQDVAAIRDLGSQVESDRSLLPRILMILVGALLANFGVAVKVDVIDYLQSLARLQTMDFHKYLLLHIYEEIQDFVESREYSVSYVWPVICYTRADLPQESFQRSESVLFTQESEQKVTPLSLA